MYTVINSQLSEFIADFKLYDDTDHFVFESKVMFLLNGLPSYYNCKITIVSVADKQMDIVYLLDAQIKEDGFEDFYKVDEQNARYLQYEAFVIEEKNKPALYIFPLNYKPKKKSLHAAFPKEETILPNRTIGFLKDATDLRRTVPQH